MSDFNSLIPETSKAIEVITEQSVKGVGEFLKIVCVPALEEFGLMVGDKFRLWRLKNIVKILEKSKGKLNFQNEKIQLNPRIALGIIDNGSVVDDEVLQEMWANLFVSSCKKEGQGDGNLIFVDLLKQLTAAEARILNHSCCSCEKMLGVDGLIISKNRFLIDFKSLTKISGINEFYRLDRELDHLITLGLIDDDAGFDGYKDLDADITPTALALNLYVKCQGHNEDPRFYWKENISTEEEE